MTAAGDESRSGVDDGTVGTVLPETFFTVLLPGMESMAELKVTLYTWRLLARRGGPRAPWWPSPMC